MEVVGYVVQYEGKFYGLFETQAVAETWSIAHAGGSTVYDVFSAGSFIEPFPPYQSTG